MPTAAAAKTIRLNYSISFPPTHGQCWAAEAWAEEIEEQARGQVKINVFPGGALTRANQCYDGVVKGISDIGMSCFAYTRGRFPVMEAVDLPLGYPDGLTASRVANAFYKKVQPKELAGVKVLYIHAHGPGLLHTKKAVNALAELKRQKIRATGLSAKVVEALGGVPVAMHQGSTYESLQKGVVEGTFGPIEVLKGWRQAEVVKFTTDCADIGYTTAMFVVMNRQKWDRLPEEIQRAFMDVSNQWIDVHGKTWDQLDIEGRDYTLGLGNKIIPLSPEENEKWKQMVRPVIDDYILETEKSGLPGRQYVDDLLELVRELSHK
jgi:TRAP-type C4-dicarboxylate transport system substrate-binding protein